MKTIIGVAVAALSLAFTSNASAAVINFDDLTSGTVVTNQYAGVTFSSQSGSVVLITTQNAGSTLPNFICSGPGFINCTDDIYVDFTTPVSDLTFRAVGDNLIGKNGEVRVLSGATLLGTVDILGDNVYLSPYLVDLSSFAGVTRIEIVNVTDPGGLGFDDFFLTPGAVGGVPEPASWAMMVTGFGLVGGAVRRAKKTGLALAA